MTTEMLRVRVELIPGGDESRARQIGFMEVWNTDPELPPESSYAYQCSWLPPDLESVPTTVRSRRVKHLRRGPVWGLIAAVLDDVRCRRGDLFGDDGG